MDEQELEALEKSVVHAATVHARIAQPVQPLSLNSWWSRRKAAQ